VSPSGESLLLDGVLWGGGSAYIVNEVGWCCCSYYVKLTSSLAAAVHVLVALLVTVLKLLIGAFEHHNLVPPRKYSALAPAANVGALMQLDAAE
jgi:hypothetical protein